MAIIKKYFAYSLTETIRNIVHQGYEILTVEIRVYIYSQHECVSNNKPEMFSLQESFW